MSLLKTLLTPRLDITSVFCNSMGADIYQVKFISRFCNKAKAWRFSYCVSALSDWIMTFLLLIQWCIRSHSTSLTNTGHASFRHLDGSGCWYHQVKISHNAVHVASPEKCADCTSCVGGKAKCSKKSSSMYKHRKYTAEALSFVTICPLLQTPCIFYKLWLFWYTVYLHLFLCNTRVSVHKHCLRKQIVIITIKLVDIGC